MKATALAPLLLLAIQAAAVADEDNRRIPAAMLEDSTAEVPARTSTGALFAEARGESVHRRPLAVPTPASAAHREVLKLLLDGRADWRLSDALIAKGSAQAAVARTHDGSYSGDEQFDLREAALQWRIGQGDVAEAGRVNLRQGAALGFNPTDYFKARTTVDTSTRDPQAQRVNRLGTFMLNAQRIGGGNSLLVAWAPRLARTGSYAAPPNHERLRVAETNAENRLLVKGQLSLSPSFSPELLAFKDAGGWRWGMNLAQAMGRQTTWFLEYSGGRRPALWQQALNKGVSVGDLPASALAASRPDAGPHWQNELAAGWTWSGENRLSLTAEFDYNQAGFSQLDWQRWRAIGSSGAGGSQLSWYLRGHANAMQAPLYQRNLFLRAQWDQAGHRDLNLNAFVNRNLDDESSLSQVSLELRLSQTSRLRFMTLFTTGRGNSLYGSDPARHAFLLGYVHYLES